jgi:hypothetical protein
LSFFHLPIVSLAFRGFVTPERLSKLTSTLIANGLDRKPIQLPFLRCSFDELLNQAFTVRNLPCRNWHDSKDTQDECQQRECLRSRRKKTA